MGEWWAAAPIGRVCRLAASPGLFESFTRRSTSVRKNSRRPNDRSPQAAPPMGREDGGALQAGPGLLVHRYGRREYDRLCGEMVAGGTFIKLNPKLRPESFLARSHPSDVARVEDRTYICSAKEEDAGPTNNWMEPEKMKAMLTPPKFDGCMKGRTMYVIAFSMGPIGSGIAQIWRRAVRFPLRRRQHANHDPHGRRGAQSTRQRRGIYSRACTRSPCHSSRARTMYPGPAAPDPKDKYIVHFPEEREIWSYGSGYGGNALLGNKCLAAASPPAWLATKVGWPSTCSSRVLKAQQGEKTYVAAAFPPSCSLNKLRHAHSAARNLS